MAAVVINLLYREALLLKMSSNVNGIDSDLVVIRTVEEATNTQELSATKEKEDDEKPTRKRRVGWWCLL